MKLTQLMSLSLLVLASSSYAEGFYGLGEVSHSRATLDGNAFNSALTANGATGLSSKTDGNSNQWRLQGGYHFNDNFSVEAGYIDFGKAKYRATYAGGAASGDLKAGGVDIAALLSQPIGSSFSVFGKLGAVAAKVKSNLSAQLPAGGLAASASTTVVRPLIGVGGSYKFAPQLSLRADFDHLSGLGKDGTTGKLNSNMFSVGLSYDF